MEQQNNAKNTNMKNGCIGCLTLIVIIALICIIAGLVKKGKSQEEYHIYNTAKVIDIMNGSGTNKIGEYSIIECNSSEVTKDTINDWYFNYVKVNNYNYCLIRYTNVESTGIYASGNMVIENAGIERDSAGDYIYTSNDNEIVYYEVNNTLQTSQDKN